ncbi:Short-chain dehydrogenase reductase SDR [Fusarium albosuccineum]|uniref:Short-chain dehydrogenase reductase SDR n=1 Tax=Fusarium albosuccineum TaxID=1237068 RepID=A0A8H4L5I8_9HYPO|nr:Short-chain dehydrogenase reductase SDR [Fusarium albosuccineum]
MISENLGSELLTFEEVRDVLMKVSGRDVRVVKRTVEELEKMGASVFGQKFQLLSNIRDLSWITAKAKKVQGEFGIPYTPLSESVQRDKDRLLECLPDKQGLSLARNVQAGGHKVIATSRNPSKTPDLVNEVESNGGKWLQLDVNSLDTGDWIRQLEDSGETIDVLVNNAGFCIHSPVETATEDEVRAQTETLLFGPLRLMRHVLPYMRERRFGIIVNFSSGGSLNGNDSMGAYAGAKAGLDGVTRVLAKEVAPFNIRALTVVLGTFNTGFASAAAKGAAPWPDDYKGSFAEKLTDMVTSGSFSPNGDKDKAMKILFDVAAGMGVGSGKESETTLLLGSDMVARAQGVKDAMQHTIDVFGGAAKLADADKM